MSGLSGALADLCDWLSGVLGEATPVRASAPADGVSHGVSHAVSTGVDVWPLELLADGASPDGPIRLRLRHVIIPAGPLPDALAVLDRVIAAVAAGDRYRPVFEPLPAHLWTATGIVPRPALVLDVPVQVARAVPDVPRVRGELAVHVVPIHAIRGRVVGPGAVPLPGITVTAGGRTAHTDPHGEFTLPGLPGDRTVPLHLSGRGRHLRADVAAHTAEPVVIHCNFEED